MPLHLERTRNYLRKFEFENLFIDELGWDIHSQQLPVSVDEEIYALEAIAIKRGVIAFLCNCPEDIPLHAVRRKIDRQVTKSHQEHFIVFVDEEKRQQIWQWVLSEPGRPLSIREHTYIQGQSGDSLLQKLEGIKFSLEEEDDLTLVDVIGRLRAAFNVERATKRFYDHFKKERDAFEAFIEGISLLTDKREYVSVMLNRLMFIYFIQKKGFLDGDINYLRNRMQIMQEHFGDDKFYSFYRYFLLRLFHEGLGDQKSDVDLENLIGKVPYLNGGIFELHKIEREHPDIQIPDAAFERIIDFFDGYQWHLDDRVLKDDKEINPDVLGYIFEQYINQKQMGAYYTKEDITGYISRNTIIPYLFDSACKTYSAAFEGENSVWRLLQENPNRYIYAAMQTGVDESLPSDIKAGLEDISKRTNWNTRTPEDYALPTEIWRETIARRQHYAEVFEKLQNGSVQEINELITLNLDIEQFAQDVIENIEEPEALIAFWDAIRTVTILDPTCGSGAFLFAALNILDPLYEACLEKMGVFVAENSTKDQEILNKFQEILTNVKRHPNQSYFILKSIAVNNLYGVDIMAEAVEIAKLRLFLKLVSQVESVEQIEPLPDIDFNLRTGNTLVGFATRDEVEHAFRGTGTAQSLLGAEQTSMGFAKKESQMKILFPNDAAVLQGIEEKATEIDKLFVQFRQFQTSGPESDTAGQDYSKIKNKLSRQLDDLRGELDQALALQYGIVAETEKDFIEWRVSHQPFHWFAEFYGILGSGGFDVIVGNPPYVEYSKVRNQYTVRNYISEKGQNLYVFVMEQSIKISNQYGRLGMILPISLVSIQNTVPLRKLLQQHLRVSWISSYAIRPAKLFEGVEQRLTIYLGDGQSPKVSRFTTKYLQWYKNERATLFHRLKYCNVTDIYTPSFAPKVGSELEKTIIGKIKNSLKETVETSLRKNTNVKLYFHRTPGYWIRMMNFEPYFKSPTSNRSIHHIRELSVVDKKISKFIGALGGSSLYFFYFFATGNCRNLTLDDVKQTPIGIPLPEVLNEVTHLFDRLMESYNYHSTIKQRGATEFQEFDWAASKSIIDHIDQCMAQHYQLNSEELDFVTNYDIKIRMGDALFDANNADNEEG